MKNKIIFSIFFIFAFIVLVYIYFNDPSEKPFVPCMFYELTGLKCPGCGITRSIYSLMHFKFIEAIKFNVFFILSLIAAIIVCILKLKNNKFKIKLNWAYIYVVFVFLFWIIRNI